VPWGFKSLTLRCDVHGWASPRVRRRVGRAVDGAGVLTRFGPEGPSEVRILHPPLSMRCSSRRGAAAVAQGVEQPVVGRKVAGSIPVGGVDEGGKRPRGGRTHAWTRLKGRAEV
jgi:hypothetical protein